ncbi:hypothetical protein ACVWZM_001780 [Bradyrhizobium sp. USDA 4501]
MAHRKSSSQPSSGATADTYEHSHRYVGFASVNQGDAPIRPSSSTVLDAPPTGGHRKIARSGKRRHGSRCVELQLVQNLSGDGMPFQPASQLG